jgi:orotidine-5'-phosphate decarboxylase
MNLQELKKQIRQKRSYLCVGLDPDIQKLPSGVPDSANGLADFCIQVAEACLPYAVSFKVNTAFFESLGSPGWEAMHTVFAYLKTLPAFIIADAKRGDIGNTSAHYARAFFEESGADAITISPYMGQDSVKPFLQNPGKTAILLALTSNEGHADFEMQDLANGQKLYEWILKKAISWPAQSDLMFVIGATRASEMSQVRKACPDHFFLVPGVGAQGGDLAEISRKGFNTEVGLLVNASRSILYASSGLDFAKAAAKEAGKIQEEMDKLLFEHGF